ncbi:protein-tyrosine-phosphatase [Entamoeba marina]
MGNSEVITLRKNNTKSALLKQKCKLTSKTQITELVKNTLYVSSRKHVCNFKEIQKYNIMAVLSVTNYSVKVEHNIEHLQLKMNDDYCCLIEEYINKSYIFIDNMISLQKPVLIHSDLGTSRSVVVIVAYVMKKFKTTFKAAYQLVDQTLCFVCLNPGFIMQLYELQVKWRNETVSSSDLLFVKELIDKSTNYYPEVPTKLLWNGFVNSNFSYEKGLKTVCRKSLNTNKFWS